MKAYKNYIFDLYGTLVDIRTDEKQVVLWEKMRLFYRCYGADYPSAETLRDSYRALVEAKEKAAVHIEEEYSEISLEEVFMELYTRKGVEATKEMVFAAGQAFRVLSLRYIRLYAGAKKLLQTLKEKGKSIYLLSNAQRIFTMPELHYLQIADCFDGILISSDYGCKKPDKRFFEALLAMYRLSPEDCLMIGNDLDSDIRGAANMGMDTFYIHSAISPKIKNKQLSDNEDTVKTNIPTYSQQRMNLHILLKRLVG